MDTASDLSSDLPDFDKEAASVYVDIVKKISGYQSSYSGTVKAVMKNIRNTMTRGLPGFEAEMADNPLTHNDYDSYCLKKRTEGTVQGITEARRRFSDILSAEQIDALFAFSNSLIMRGGYNCDVDRYNLVALSSAIYILDELMINGNISEIYQYLPVLNEKDYDETFCLPVKHPIYGDDLIFSLVFLIRHRNTSKPFGDSLTGSLVWKQEKADTDNQSEEYRSAFDSIIALMNPDSINRATQHFEEKVWEFYRICFSIIAAVEKRENVLIQERDNLQNQLIGMTSETINKKNVLLMPGIKKDVLINNVFGGQDSERRQEQLRKLENEIVRLEKVSLTRFSLPNDREKQAKSLIDIIPETLAEELIAFHVEDPFETAFALLYLMDTNSIIPWFYYGSLTVGYTMCDQLPYDTKPEIPQKPVRLDDWDSALYQHRYKGYRFENINDSLGEPVMREHAKNLSQLVFSNTLSLIPRVVPEQADLTSFYNGFGELSDHEKEAYSLLSYALIAGQLRTDSVREYRAVHEAEQLLADSGEEALIPLSSEDEKQLKAENDRLRAKNKELVEKISDLLGSRKTDSKQVKLLQHQIELLEKELSDLREAVYLLENDGASETTVDESIRYPFATSGRIICFGGHETWLKEMRKKLPNMVFFSPDALPNIDLIRNADTVWLQTNCLSHADFFRIINAVRQNGIPIRYFSFAGAGKCAEQLVKSICN